MKIISLPASIRTESDVLQGELFDDEHFIGGVFLEMGVLDDGTPFLTQRGLARLCGVQNAHIGTISRDWNDQITKPRVTKIRDILSRRNLFFADAHSVVNYGGKLLHAYPEEVTIAILEYYAFEAGHNLQQEAIQNFRQLASGGLRKLVD